ncbi:hypothetical protein PLEOSDRAFT_164050 [Pleurotus ostreatus PC15]|uniref:Uncharacterized protein n=1 Tax=Pleurotus ostreatus (strain PC15) TaxID=1137138 RepID=A0A067PC72_PLEO1|nr:hypothetical protein PLEOSDRAFT_164050 [Pleurotus ostreatus PC15]
MTRTYATRSRATQRADTPENPELTGEPQGLFLPTNPERSVVSDTERDESPPAKPKHRSYSDVVAKRVEPSAEENHNNETPLALDEESDEFVTTQRELNPEQAEAVRSAVDGMDAPVVGLLYIPDCKLPMKQGNHSHPLPAPSVPPSLHCLMVAPLARRGPYAAFRLFGWSIGYLIFFSERYSLVRGSIGRSISFVKHYNEKKADMSHRHHPND